MDDRLQSIYSASTDLGIPRRCTPAAASYVAKSCELGIVNAATTLVLFGDSHAMQWGNALNSIAQARKWRLVVMVKVGCAASDINPHHRPADADVCIGWRKAAIQQIVALHPSAVVMASYDGATYRADPLTDGLMPADEIRTGSRRTLEQFSRAGIPVLVLRDSPLPPHDIPECIARRLRARLSFEQSCDFDALPALNERAFLAERAAAEGLREIDFLDMSDRFCPGERCPAIQSDLIVYRDENHLTGRFAASLAPVIQVRLLTLLESSQTAQTAATPPVLCRQKPC